jgi:hypothetical protein
MNMTLLVINKLQIFSCTIQKHLHCSQLIHWNLKFKCRTGISNNCLCVCVSEKVVLLSMDGIVLDELSDLGSLDVTLTGPCQVISPLLLRFFGVSVFLTK